MMCLANETQVLVGDFLCVSIVLSSKKVPFGRYALRAIPPTSWAPPVHKSRATSRPRKHISPERYWTHSTNEKRNIDPKEAKRLSSFFNDWLVRKNNNTRIRKFK